MRSVTRTGGQHGDPFSNGDKIRFKFDTNCSTGLVPTTLESGGTICGPSATFYPFVLGTPQWLNDSTVEFTVVSPPQFCPEPPFEPLIVQEYHIQLQYENVKSKFNTIQLDGNTCPWGLGEQWDDLTRQAERPNRDPYVYDPLNLFFSDPSLNVFCD